MDEFITNFYDILDETEKHEIDKDTDFKNLDEWDSMTTLMLIAMVNENYGKQIKDVDLKESLTLESLFMRIQSK
jgi:acyl carrier protein